MMCIRTVYFNQLLIGNASQGFYIKQKRGRQQRDRKRECVRGRALRREGDGVGNKIDY